LNSRNPSEFNAPQRRAHSDDQFTTGLEFWTIRNENLIYPTTQAHAAAPQLCSTRTSWFAEGPHHAPGNRQIVRSDRPRRKALSACQQISPQKARRPAQRSQRYWADPNSAADVLSSRRPPKAVPDLQAPEQTIDQGTRSGKPRRQSLRLRRLSLTCYCLPCLRFPDPPLARAIKTKLTGRRLHSAG
jgi:hypothetical protein